MEILEWALYTLGAGGVLYLWSKALDLDLHEPRGITDPLATLKGIVWGITVLITLLVAAIR